MKLNGDSLLEDGQTVELALTKLRESALEARHRAGYEHHPVEPGEFNAWYSEQAWPEWLAPKL